MLHEDASGEKRGPLPPSLSVGKAVGCLRRTGKAHFAHFVHHLQHSLVMSPAYRRDKVHITVLPASQNAD